MKKIIYSVYTKLTAAVLIIVCAVLCMNVVIDTMTKYTKSDDEYIYRFENNFNESNYIANLLNEPVNSVNSAYMSFRYDNDPAANSNQSYLNEPDIYEENTEIADTENTETADTENNVIVWNQPERPVEDYVDRSLKYLENLPMINYYVQINDAVFTNCGAAGKEDIMKDRFYFILEKDADGNADYNSSNLQLDKRGYYYLDRENLGNDTVMVYTSIKDEYASSCETIWNEQAQIIRQAFTQVLVLIILIILLLAYLIAAAGKTAEGGYKKMWVDSIWTEVHLAVIILPALLVLALNLIVLDELFQGQFPMYMAKSIALLSTAIGMSLILTSLLSIVRKIKTKTFADGSIIVRIVRWAWRTVKKIFGYICKYLKDFKSILSESMSKKTDMLLIGTLFVYTALIGICGIFVTQTIGGLLFGALFFGFACFAVCYRVKDLDEIKRGVSEIRNGNLSYKIPELKNGDLKILANDVNEIAKGLDESVASKLKAERLKTDLITNVSHDLKTPLTSIISYTELLSNVEGLPEEAKDYIQIIAKKSDRLKKLTQDLFDISKVQSGNESVVLEKIDVSLLINQSLGEHDNEIKKSNLPFCINVDKGLYISADGRKMSRVISNLISNILKYTMQNTRVFISAFEKDGEIVIEFKNIASYPMDFAADEIVGRFVRGDESRTAEGNGLGLAIAKSYTEVCGGRFEVVTDGDMFKAIIKFNKIS